MLLPSPYCVGSPYKGNEMEIEQRWLIFFKARSHFNMKKPGHCFPKRDARGIPIGKCIQNPQKSGEETYFSPSSLKPHLRASINLACSEHLQALSNHIYTFFLILPPARLLSTPNYNSYFLINMLINSLSLVKRRRRRWADKKNHDSTWAH